MSAEPSRRRTAIDRTSSFDTPTAIREASGESDGQEAPSVGAVSIRSVLPSRPTIHAAEPAPRVPNTKERLSGVQPPQNISTRRARRDSSVRPEPSGWTA
jgi:hypothetical protein